MSADIRHGTITWQEINGQGFAVLAWQDGETQREPLEDPITARTDAWSVVELFSVAAVNVDHDREYIHVQVGKDNPEYTVLKLSGGSLGSDRVKIRGQLSVSEGRIDVDYCEGNGWESTGHSCYEVRNAAQLAALGRELAADAIQMDRAAFSCDWTEVDK